MKKPKVFVVGADPLVGDMFTKNNYERVYDCNDTDLVCFTGGSDVTPELYGEQNVSSKNDLTRDKYETNVFRKAFEKKLPMVGICRGSQFLNVMSGGRLWQDVDNHAISSCHEMTDTLTNEKINTTSTHHQMMRPSAEAVIIAISYLTTRKRDQRGDYLVNSLCDHEQYDVEVAHYPDTQCLCVQGHPEYANAENKFVDYFFDNIRTLLGVKNET